MTDINERLAEAVCILSSIVIRLGSYVFLRWIPGHVFPHTIFTAFALFSASFAYLYRRREPYTVIADETEVKLSELPEREKIGYTDENANGDAEEDVAAETVAEETSEGEGTEQDQLITTKESVLELEATETIVIRKNQSNPLKTLLTGRPSASSKALTWVTFLINLLAVSMVADLTYRSELFYKERDLSFARPGYASPHTARIVLREPNPNALPIGISYREEEFGKPTVGPWVHGAEILHLSPETDFVATVDLTNLHPDREYRYKTSTGHTGRFKTAPSYGSAILAKKPHGKFTFLTSSCLKPRVPYNPFDHPLAVKGLKQLGDVLKKGREGKVGGVLADFMLFLGDFIYIDVPKRPSNPTREGYRMHYRQVYGSPDWPGAGNDLPWLHVVDDHEIANDWDQNVTGIYPLAMDPFHIYQHSANPPPHRIGETYYSFKHGPASFFMIETRRYRSKSDAPDGPHKTMLGHRQLEDVLEWIKDDSSAMENVQWKFFVSSSAFTQNWKINANDSWAGYMYERQRILEAMWSMNGKFGFVVLSGDRHEFAATAFPPPPSSKHPQTATVYEFSCSPLNQFWLPPRTYYETPNTIELPTPHNPASMLSSASSAASVASSAVSSAASEAIHNHEIHTAGVKNDLKDVVSPRTETWASDVMIKYIPRGNSKFGAVEVDATNKGSGQAVLKYRLFVDGEETWDYVLTKQLGVGREKKASRRLWE